MNLYQTYIKNNYKDFKQHKNPNMITILGLDSVEHDIISSELMHRNGYIYIANNNQFNYFKVGRTKKHPLERIKTLNSAGVLHELQLVRFFHVEDVILESFIHQSLTTIYPNAKYKEFFNLPLNLIENVIEEEIKTFNLFLSYALYK